MRRKSKVKENILKRVVNWFLSGSDEKSDGSSIFPDIHFHFHLNYYKVKGEMKDG